MNASITPRIVAPTAARARSAALPDHAAVPTTQVATGSTRLDSMEPARAPRVELNPGVSADTQRKTWQRTLALGAQLAREGKIPVIVIDHRLTGLDERPITIRGLERLARAANIPELQNVDRALTDGILRNLPGYTEQASDHWRGLHPELLAHHPGAFGDEGTRLPIGFMNEFPSNANAAPGLAELAATWKLETLGLGEIIFVGAGTGSVAEFASVYTRPIDRGGAGLVDADVRHGAPTATPDARRRSQALVDTFNAMHPDEPPVQLDHDSDGKAGWIEAIEREIGDNGQQKVVAAFVDDRAHNRFGAIGAAKLGTDLIAIKSATPGLSFSQNDNGNPNQISTFHPVP